MDWVSVKLPDNFQIHEHSRPCLFHIMRASASSLWYKMCTLYLEFFWQTNMASHSQLMVVCTDCTCSYKSSYHTTTTTTAPFTVIRYISIMLDKSLIFIYFHTCITASCLSEWKFGPLTLNPQLFIVVHVPSQESVRSCICVLRKSIK